MLFGKGKKQKQGQPNDPNLPVQGAPPQAWTQAYDDSERLKPSASGLDGGIDPFSNIYRKKSTRRRNWTIAIRNIALVGGTVGVLALGSTIINTAQQTRENTEAINSYSNPSFQTRHQEIGRQVVINYLKGGYSPISYTKDVTWATASPLLDTNAQSTTANTGDTAQADDEVDTSAQDAQAIQDSSKNVNLTQVTFISGYQTELVVPNGDLDRHPDMVGAKLEVLTYYAVLNGQPVYINLSIASPKDINKLPILIATPTIDTPTAVEAVSGLRNEPLGRDSSVSLSKESQQQLNRWAKAWAQNDTATLKQISGDDNVQARYEGLGNWNVDPNATVKVQWSYLKAYATHPGQYIIARVSFDMYQNVQLEGQQEPQRITNKQTMDVVIGGNDTGLPTVVSWGPAGTFDDIQPFSVADVSRENEKMPDTVITDEPTVVSTEPSGSEE